MKNNLQKKANIEQLRKAMIERILKGDGKASLDQRRAAFDNIGLTKPFNILIDKVAKYSYKVTDEDIAAMKDAGFSEDQIFELVICAAIGQSSRQYEAGLAALESAVKKERSKHEA